MLYKKEKETYAIYCNCLIYLTILSIGTSIISIYICKILFNYISLPRFLNIRLG